MKKNTPEEEALYAKMREEGYRIAESCATCLRAPGTALSEDGWAKCHGPNRKYIAPKKGEVNLPAHPHLVCDAWRPHSRIIKELGEYASEPWLGESREADKKWATEENLRNIISDLDRAMVKPSKVGLHFIARTLNRAAFITRTLIRTKIDVKFEKFMGRTKGLK